MVFGRAKKKPDQSDDNQSTIKKLRSKSNRDSSSYRRMKPKDDEITDIEHHTLTCCPDCNTKLTRLKVVERFIEDILPLAEWYKALKKVVKHFIATGYCSECKERKTVIPITPQVSIIGHNLKQYIGFATIIQRLSYQQIKDFLIGTLRLNISDGEIANILAEQSIQLHPEFEALKAKIRHCPRIRYLR